MSVKGRTIDTHLGETERESKEGERLALLKSIPLPHACSLFFSLSLDHPWVYGFYFASMSNAVAKGHLFSAQ